MRVIRATDAQAFARRVEPYLLTHEAEHCLPIGILKANKANADGMSDAPYMAYIEDESGDVALVALQTPPQNLILSRLATSVDAHAALRGIASDARDACGALPGVIGPKEVAEQFSQMWSNLTRNTYHVALQERIYQLRQVIPPRPASGYMRHIKSTDRLLLRAWLRDFILEALGPDSPDTPENILASRIPGDSNKGMYMWVDGDPVAIAGFGGPTPHGIRIGPVYTPPDQRGHGYASALVAETSQSLIDSGRDYCFLFTDLANSTSNHIYQQVGYEPVGDVSVYAFQEAERPGK